MCEPNTATCNGNVAHTCNADGSGFTDITCDPTQGETCDETTPGGCTGMCAPASLGQSYIGCEYFPTVTGNPVNNDFAFAVVISNTSTVPAMITIEGGALASTQTATVPPNSTSIQKLPWVNELKLCMDPSSDPDEIQCTTPGNFPLGAMAPAGAYHLRSTAPVTVYQFNSYDYAINNGGEFSFTNDASLMLPTNVWRSTYLAASWQQTGSVNPSELAVTAAYPNTNVTLTTKADTTAAGGAPAFATGVPQMVTLNTGDVLEITTVTGDLTGTQISANSPVQVISGHYCADIPDGVAACDHLEESMFGIDTLGSHYIVSSPAVDTEPTGKVEVVRIVAAAPNITLTYDPPQSGAPTTLANVGDFVEIDNNASEFAVTASGKILVAQYMEGQDADGAGTGDPAMALAVPVEQFRTNYLFQAPLSYDSNYVDIVAPMGATVSLDGAAAQTFTAIGTSGFGLSRVLTLGPGPNADGSHSITGDMPFGITVYGYGQYTSYWYPGGLNLTSVFE
nr:IgGFc-binding protein [Kofleriaceae bacterium]